MEKAGMEAGLPACDMGSVACSPEIPPAHICITPLVIAK